MSGARVPENARRRWAARVLLGLMVPSGFAGLGYQIVWTAQSAAWLGHEAASVLAVVGAFFGGLAVGALALGERIESSARPRRFYVACELSLAAWGALLLWALPVWSGWLMSAIGPEPSPARQWVVAFGGTFLALLPATAAMGATLPAMERLTSIFGATRPEGAATGAKRRSVAALYAANTAGAVLGVLATAFYLIPRWGLTRSGAVCVALNVICGVVALAILPKRSPPEDVRADDGRDEDPAALAATSPAGAVACRRRARGLQVRLAATGFLGIGYEVVVVRVLSQVSEDTVYTFALLLTVYLVGTAAGAATYHRWRERPPERRAESTTRSGEGRGDEIGRGLLAALAVACLAGGASLWAASVMKTLAARLLGGGMAAALAAEAAPALLAFGPPTVVMGAVFSHLSREARAAGVSFGRSLGVNTAAAATAPAAFGVVALPILGAKHALLVIVCGYLLTLGPRAWRGLRARPARATALGAATVAAVAVVATMAPALTFVDVPEGGRVVSYREGVLGAVSVVEDAAGVARLRIDNRQQEGSSATWRVDARQAWLPLLLHPGPRRALFLGLGTGVTATAAADDPSLVVEAVELLPEVIAAAVHFRAEEAAGGPSAGAERLHAIAGDARRFVRASHRRYDVIVADNFHPARSGSGALYTVEHFQAVRARLEPGGLFCQWLPLHQLDLATVRSIVRSFVTASPQAWAVLASNSLETPVLGLIARAPNRDGPDRGDARFDAAGVRARLAELARSTLPARAARLGFEDELAVLGSAVAGPAALRRFAETAPANTDDRPVVTYGAPRLTYAPGSSPRDRLIELVTELGVTPDELLASPARDGAFAARLAAYWTARDQFLASGRDVRPSPRVQEMLAQVEGPLLAVLRLSPDFRPAYDPLLAMAATLARTDAAGARVLLAELTRLQPGRGDAPQLLAALGARAGTAQVAASENRKP